MTFSQEFFFFLKTFGIIKHLVIAFVIGQAASTLVNAFVKDIIDPLIGLFLPWELAALTVQVPNLAGTTTTFKYGDLISNIINFLVIALVVFVAYKRLSKYNIVEDKD